MKTALEHPWFKKFGLKTDDNNPDVNKNFKKNNSIKNDFGIYTAAVKKH